MASCRANVSVGAHSSASRICKRPSGSFSTPGTKIPNLLFGRLRWNRSWKSCLAVGKRSRRFNPDALCHGAERRAIKLSSYFADTTLAIDDDPQSLSLITDALVDEELEILTAEDPEAGFEMFLRLRPRIVLLDLLMPGAQGMGILRLIISADPGANVIMISGHCSEESAMEAIQQRACDYLTKPLDFQRLRHRIASFLAEERRRTLSWIRNWFKLVNSRRGQ